ncbi:MAG: ribonucleotide reductase subunit alpha [Gammaproteobacteria bacterium]|nr:MAG: ribonucleotide reductase subunit alpha [Gammaproteobacteria bacterium]
MTEITNYQSLLTVGKQQQEPQRFLFVFLQASLPDNHNDADKQRFHSGLGGELQAIMCVDKDLAELTDFTDLVNESKQMEQDWSMVLIACLSGRNSIPPTADEAEQALKIMVQTVQNGADLSKYLAFDRQGVLLHFA